MGHQVTVVTGFPSVPEGHFYPQYKLRPWSIKTVNGVRVVRIPLYPDNSRSTLRRILSYCSFALSVVLLTPFLIRKLHVIYVFHPPLTLGLAAVWIGFLKRARFLYGVHDMWPESILATGMLKDNWIASLLRTMERFVYRRAGAIGVISPGYTKNLIGKGVPPEKIHLLTDWADEEVYNPVAPDSKLAVELNMLGKFNIVFGGHLGLAQGLDTVIEAAQLLKNKPNLQIVFAGDGLERTHLEAETSKRGLTNVLFLGQRPAEQMKNIYALADVLLVHLKAGNLSSINIPSKIYAYLACGKPLLVALDGTAASLLNTIGAGLVCSPEDPQAMADTIRAFQVLPAEELRAMGDAGRGAFLSDYSREIGVVNHERVLVSLWRGRDA